jgi:hypothetical protein
MLRPPVGYSGMRPPVSVVKQKLKKPSSAIDMTEIFPRRNAIPNQPLQFLDFRKTALIFS